MVNFLMIRHGQSAANLTNCFAGHWDSPATDLGLQQALLAAKYVAKTYAVDAVYSSDLKRAAAVGEAVAAATGLTMQPDRRLREIDAGQWEGKPFLELVEEFPSFFVWRNDIGSACCDGGESVEQLQKRILAALKDIAAKHPGQTVVIATHATPIRVTQCHAMGLSLDEMKNVPWVSNASLTRIAYDGQFRVVEAGFDGYLGDATSVLPVNV